MLDNRGRRTNLHRKSSQTVNIKTLYKIWGHFQKVWCKDIKLYILVVDMMIKLQKLSKDESKMSIFKLIYDQKRFTKFSVCWHNLFFKCSFIYLFIFNIFNIFWILRWTFQTEWTSNTKINELNRINCNKQFVIFRCDRQFEYWMIVVMWSVMSW